MERILSMAAACIDAAHLERPESIWLKTKYEEFRKRYGLKSKAATDTFLYEKMYGRKPGKLSDVLKIRYWRTGQHMPVSTEECVKFGKALEFSETDMEFLLKQYFERCTEKFTNEKRVHLSELIDEYLEQIPKDRLELFNILPDMKRQSIRHLYYTDAMNYICKNQMLNRANTLQKHITSAHYNSEFFKLTNLTGTIPRKTMIRHLIILGMPKLTLKKLNEELTYFGYLPLTEEHTMIGGECLDRLLIHLFQEYEKKRKSNGEENAYRWFQKTCRVLDAFFLKYGYTKWRFMYFRALG